MNDIDLIAALKNKNTKTNIREIDLGEIETHQLVMFGYTLQNLPDDSSKDFPLNFGPVQALYIDKLVSDEAINNPIKTTREDFFKAFVVMDYAATVFFDDFSMFARIAEFGDEMERRDPELDPNLEFVLKYIVAQYLMNNILDPSTEAESKERYDRLNVVAGGSFDNLRDVPSHYISLAALVVDQINNEVIKDVLPTINSRYDIKAAIFCDAALDFIDDECDIEFIENTLLAGREYDASVYAITTLCKLYANASISMFRDEFEE